MSSAVENLGSTSRATQIEQTSESSPTETPTPDSPSFEIAVDSPETATVREPVRIAITVTNTGQDGTFDSIVKLEKDEPSGEMLPDSFYVSLVVPAGETRTWEKEFTYDHEYDIHYLLEKYDVEWDIVVLATKTPPKLLKVNLVSGWETYGDVAANAILSAEAGSEIKIGFRHEYYLHEGTFDITEQVRIFDSDGNRVANQPYTDEQLFTGNGYQLFEHALSFATQDWGEGEYTAEVLLRDNVTSSVSHPMETTFTLK